MALPKIIIRPYNFYSRSAKLLKENLKQIVKNKILVSKKLKFSRKNIILNWGSTDPKLTGGKELLNHPNIVGIACNKYKTLQFLKDNDIPCVEFTKTKQTAQKWLDEKNVVYCRTLLTSHSGKGIVLVKSGEQLVDAPLYTKRFKNGREYRVHVAFGKVTQIVQKKLRKGVKDENGFVRSNNNWVFARNIENIPKLIPDLALQSVGKLGLSIAAIDIGYSVRDNDARIFEINTAPGLDNTSAVIYANAIKEKVA